MRKGKFSVSIEPSEFPDGSFEVVFCPNGYQKICSPSMSVENLRDLEESLREFLSKQPSVSFDGFTSMLKPLEPRNIESTLDAIRRLTSVSRVPLSSWEFKGTLGSFKDGHIGWRSVYKNGWGYMKPRYEIQSSDDGECTAEFVENKYDAALIAQAPALLAGLMEAVNTIRSMGAPASAVEKYDVIIYNSLFVD